MIVSLLLELGLSSKNKTNMRDRARNFCSATRQLFVLCGGPRLPIGKVGSLHAFGGIPTAGLPVRPVLCAPKHVFTELAHQAMNHRKCLNGREDSSGHWCWPPYYQRPPPILWNNSAVMPAVHPLYRLRCKTAPLGGGIVANRDVTPS